MAILVSAETETSIETSYPVLAEIETEIGTAIRTIQVITHFGDTIHLNLSILNEYVANLF